MQTNVKIEPALIPINNPNSSADINGNNTADGARADIRARGFWRNGQSSLHFLMYGLQTPSPHPPLKLQSQRF